MGRWIALCTAAIPAGPSWASRARKDSGNVTAPCRIRFRGAAASQRLTAHLHNCSRRMARHLDCLAILVSLKIQYVLRQSCVVAPSLTTSTTATVVSAVLGLADLQHDLAVLLSGVHQAV